MKTFFAGILALMLVISPGAAARASAAEEDQPGGTAAKRDDENAEKQAVEEAVVTHNPRLRSVWRVVLAEGRVSTSDVIRGLRTVDSVLKREPGSNEALALKSWLRLVSEDYADACKTYAKVLADGECNKQYVDVLCRASLRGALTSSDASERCGGVRALTALPPAKAEKLLPPSFAAPSADVRRQACRVAAELDLMSQVDAMKTILDEKDDLTRAMAARCLAKMGDTSGLEAAAEVLALSNNDKARAAAMNAIGLCGEADEATTRRLHKALTEDNPEIPRAAAVALMRLDDPAGKKQLNLLMTDRNPLSRRWAANALATLDSADGRNWLIERLAKDDDSGVRAATATALGRMGATQAIAPLKAALDDFSWDVRVCAARALDSLGEQAPMRIYQVGWQEESFLAKSGSIHGLAERGTADDIVKIAAQMTSPDSGIRIAAVNAIATLADEDGLPYLAAGLGDKNDLVRLTTAALITEVLSD